MKYEKDRISLCRSCEVGITLIELLVVIAIASVVLALVFPAVGAGMSGLNLRASARKVVGAVHYARGKAIHMQEPYLLLVNQKGGVIVVSDLYGHERYEYILPEQVEIDEITGDLLPGQFGELATSIRRFEFQPDGMVPPIDLTLAITGRRVRIITDALTGSAKIVEANL